MIHAHGELRIGLLKDARQFDDVGSATKMACLGEVAVGEDVAAAQMYEPSAGGIFPGQLHQIVLRACRERPGAERKAVVRVGYGVEKPLNVLVAGHNAGQTEHLEGRIVGMHTHIDVALAAYRHDGFEEIFHVLTQLPAVDALIAFQQLAEKFYGMFVAFLEVARHESLRLNDDILHQGMVFFGRHAFFQLVHFGEDVSFVGLAVGTERDESLPVFPRAIALEDMDVEVGKLRNAEVEVARSVGILVQEVGPGPVEYRHEVVADGVDAFCGEVAHAFLVDLDLSVTVGTGKLDGLGDGQRLHDAPAKAETLNIAFQVVYFLSRPHLTERNIVQSRNDALYAYLFEHGKRDFVVLAKPSPCSFHS
ncbi:hypothetical protein HMPREF1870_00227 [Bacteroidales bacterium KA00344]|nr:hypothetical protein HMPREF1870_00227 [Bacteroidales bacterium KA00344]